MIRAAACATAQATVEQAEHLGIARDKAYTAAGFGFPPLQWKDILSGNAQLQAGIVERPRVVTFGDGVPIFDGEDLIGAIDVSGA